MKIELHCHTNISDCLLSIDEVLELAVAEGVTHLAVTNHDTTKGLNEAIEIGKRYGIEVIPCIEMSGFDFVRGRRVHILGYFIEPGHERNDENHNAELQGDQGDGSNGFLYRGKLAAACKNINV